MEKNHDDSMKNLLTLKQILDERREREKKAIQATSCIGVPNKTILKILQSLEKVNS